MAEASAAGRARAREQLAVSRAAEEQLARERERDRRARIPEFQANLKVGDRVRLADCVVDARSNVALTGLVIGVNRPLAYVQLDNATIAGQGTRWLEITALQPVD